MGYSSANVRWTDEILAISSNTEYMSAVVSIVDPILVTRSGSWDIETNTPPTIINDGVIADSIRARINWPLRSVKDPGTQDANPGEIRAGRMSILWDDYSGPLRTGLQVYIVSGGDNVDLTRTILRVEEALNSSNSATRVMKVSVEGETSYATAPTPGG